MHLRIRLIGSGSSGNAAIVRAGRVAVMLDAGVAVSRLEAACAAEGLAPSGLDGVFLSHEHGDHASGAGLFSKRHRLPVFCAESVEDGLARGRRPLVRAEPLGTCVDLGALRVRTFPVPHDSPNLGFRIEANGVRVGIVTDLGRVTPEVIEGLRECHTLMIESNYDDGMLRDGPYPVWLKERIGSPTGHLSNADAAELLETVAAAETRRVVLLHLSEKNNEPDRARTVAEAALFRAGRWNVEVDVATRAGLPRPLEF